MRESRSSRRSPRRLAALVIVAGFTAVACGGGGGTVTPSTDPGSESPTATTSEVAPGVEVVMAVPQDLTALDPMNGQFVTMGIIFENVVEGLVAMDGQTSALIPVLAESWELVDDTTWRFVLREGVSFHNGEPFDAAAVQFSLERMQDESLGFQHAGEFTNVAGIEVVDPYTVDFITSVPMPELPRSLVFLSIVPPEFTQSAADAINGRPVGTGPYMFESGDDQQAIFVANPDYWGGAPALEKVTVIARPEDAARVAALQADEVDIIWSLPAERLDDVPNVISAATLENNALLLNGEVGPTTDPRVREALAIGIDVETIRTSLLGDEVSSPARCQWYPEGVFGFNPDIDSPAYDPDRARELIDEANAGGTRIGISAPVGRIPGGEQFVQAIGPYIEAMGLVPDIQIKEYQAWIADDVRGPDDGPATIEALFAGINSFTGSASRPLNTVVKDGARVERFPHEDNPDVGPLVAEASQTLDDAERERLFQEVTSQVCASNAFVFLYNYKTLWGTAEGVDFTPRFDERIVFDTIRVSG